MLQLEKWHSNSGKNCCNAQAWRLLMVEKRFIFMDSIINELIRLDRKAKDAIEAAQQQRDEAKQQLAQHKEELLNNATCNIQDEIYQERQKLNDELNTKLKTLETNFSENEKRIDEAFAQNFDAFVKSITTACLTASKTV